MNKHAWISDVMCDLESYMLAHGGENSCAAVRFARFVAEEELCRREETAVMINENIVSDPETVHLGRCQLVVDNSLRCNSK